MMMKPSPDIELYSYFRSSSSYRVRIALHLKALEYHYIPVHLLKEGGQQHQKSFRDLNPLGEVPCLRHGPLVLSQSMAILNYLDSLAPEPPLFPHAASKRAQVVQACEMVNSGIQPLQNLGVMQKLAQDFGASEEQKQSWSRHWIQRGLRSLEVFLRPMAGIYCFGDEVTAADLYLIPQLYNARRFSVEPRDYPLLAKIEESCLQIEAFQKAAPGQQPDTPAER